MVDGVATSMPTMEPPSSLQEQTWLFDETLLFLEEHQRILAEIRRDLERRIRNNEAGILGEQAVAEEVRAVLQVLGESDWVVLVDRVWPGSRANIDLILVGPPGVLVLDAKNWREPRIENGRLWRGDASADDQVDKVRSQGDAVAAALSGDGVAPTVVQPLLVLAGHDVAECDIDGVTVLGQQHLHAALVRMPRRLGNTEIDALAVAVAVACPSKAAASAAVRPVLLTSRIESFESSDVTSEGAEQTALVDRDAMWDALIAAASARPIETWMTWLHPTQSTQATRTYAGPARIRGAAGTGKTVVALHRARHLSRDRHARVLVTTFVNSLPAVQRSLFEQLSPMTTDRVEFVNLHRWALGLLGRRQVAVDLGEPGRDHRSVLTQSWAATGVGRDLAATGMPMHYWQDEIAHVIKGRGLNEVTDYLELTRIGRRLPLRQEQRLLVWTLFEEYQRRMCGEGLWDFEDVVTAALQSLHAEPLESPYTSVIVDEAQDLSCEGMRLLHELVGDRPDGLLVVGDGQQAVYPGGFTLREAGVNIQGRSTVLTRNYRNGSEILRAALEIVNGDQFPDLDDDDLDGTRDCEADRAGGVVRTFPSVDRRSQRDELLADLRLLIDAGTRPGDVALLVRTVASADEWITVLRSAGFDAESLRDYQGIADDRVKVGTYQRAKGLEFAAVYVPDLDLAITRPSGLVTEESLRDRNELERRSLFVAMTRARDRLWLGRVAADIPASAT